MTFEEEYEDVLHSIEYTIALAYRQHLELTDVNVDNALEDLIRAYTAELRNRAAPGLRLNALEQELYDRVAAVCEWQLGRGELDLAGDQVRFHDGTPVTVDEMIACLKRIRKSIKTWTKDYGRRGYLDFVNQFFPSE